VNRIGRRRSSAAIFLAAVAFVEVFCSVACLQQRRPDYRSTRQTPVAPPAAHRGSTLRLKPQQLRSLWSALLLASSPVESVGAIEPRRADKFDSVAVQRVAHAMTFTDA